MANLEAFKSPDFDAKAYINELCATGSTEPLDRYLAEMEMKLHLTAEDISLQLEDEATRASQRIPAAVRELLHIKDDVLAVRTAVGTTLTQLQKDTHPTATSAVNSLKELDVVKQRMEAACNTLKEAAGLSSLFHMVDEYFAAGDFARVAEALRGIKRGLSIVGDSVPEFRDGGDRLDKLEQRFAAALEHPLTTALSKHKGDDAMLYSDMLASIGKEELVHKLYTTARMPALQQLWDSYTQDTPFVSWLSTFYDQVVHSMTSEFEWCRSSLPHRYPTLPLSLLFAFVSKTDKPCRARLVGSLTGASGSVLPLESLEQAQDAAVDFASAIHAMLEAAEALNTAAGINVQFVDIYTQIFAPVEAVLQGYADREMQYLQAELQEVASKGCKAALADPQTASKSLSSVISQAITSGEAAISRCLKLTQGTALPALTRVLDRVLHQHVKSLQTTVHSLRGRASSDASSFEASDAVLPLLLVATNLLTSVGGLERALHQAASQHIASLLPQADEHTATHTPTDIDSTEVQQQQQKMPSAAVLRLHAQPALYQQLSAFLNHTTTTTPHLATTAAACTDFAHTVEDLVSDMLCAKINLHLGSVSDMPEWTAKPTGTLALPAFTPYPLQYVTSVGEYLMMLPQVLESSLGTSDDTVSPQDSSAAAAAGIDGSAGGSNNGTMVADWIDKVALTAAHLYEDQLSQLQGLTPQGAAQLSADLEYFTNVLATLGVAISPTLAAWQAASGAGAEDMSAVLAAAKESADSHAEGVIEVVAKLRGVSLNRAVS